jgi:hypothetical protein
VKIWKVKALTNWPAGCRVQFDRGERVGDFRAALFGDGTPISAGTVIEVVLDCQTGEQLGNQRGVWRIVDVDGNKLVGDDLVVDVNVAKPL